MKTCKVRLSIFGTFKEEGVSALGYATSFETLELNLDEGNDNDTQARIGIYLGSFVEEHIDKEKDRANRELVSLSHTLLLVPI